MRKNAWVNHRLDLALGAPDPNAAMVELLNRPHKTFDAELVPADGSWPPGADVEEHRRMVRGEPLAPVDTAAPVDSPLSRALAAAGVAI